MGKLEFVYQRRIGWKKKKNWREMQFVHISSGASKKIKIRNFRFNNFFSLFLPFSLSFALSLVRQALSFADDVLMQRARCIARRIEGSQQPTIFTWLLWPALCSARSCPTVKSGSFMGPVQLSYEMCVLVLLSVVLASTCKNEMWLKWILSMPYSKACPNVNESSEQRTRIVEFSLFLSS